MTDFVSEASTDDHARARIVANRSVLVQVQRPQAEDPDGLLLAPVFRSKLATMNPWVWSHVSMPDWIPRTVLRCWGRSFGRCDSFFAGPLMPMKKLKYPRI